ncbi:hypothetical protein [Thermoactinospora rubra]|nr:hypothetical protein [Thermoactinospora rubra]
MTTCRWAIAGVGWLGAVHPAPGPAVHRPADPAPGTCSLQS